MRRIPASLALTLLPLMAGSARADLAYQYPGVLEGVTPGWFCLEVPDSAVKDMDGAGHVNLFQRPFDFEEETDHLASQPGIGIGVVARMGPFGRDDIYTAQAVRGGDEPQRWRTRVRPDGLVWMGYLGGFGEGVPAGEWHFSLWRGADQVFDYVIVVDPPNPAEDNRCVASVS